MTSQDLLVVALYTGVTIGLSVLAILVMGGMFEFERRLQKWVIPFVLPTIAFAIAVGSVFSGRNLNLVAFDAGLALMAQVGGGRNLLRGITIVILAVCLCRIGAEWLAPGKKPRDGSLLLVAFMAFFFTNVVLSSAFGTKPSFIHNLFYAPIVMLAAYASRTHSPTLTLDAAKWALVGFMLASLLAAVMWPAGTVQQAYEGLLPGLKIRLWGLGSNANSIGPLAFVLLLLTLHRPFPRKWLQSVSILLAVTVIVLAQSKTAWVAGVAACAVLAYFKTRARRTERADADRRTFAPTALAGLAAMLTCGLLLASFFVDLGSAADRLAASKQGASLLTLTGRDVVWSVAIDEWHRNPLFGYGPSLWSADYRQSIGIAFAFSAHNQLLQSLAGAGTLGALGLAFYLLALTVYGTKAAIATRGLSAALLVLLLLRCVTEAPLETNTIFGGEFFSHLLLFVVLVSYASRVETRTPVDLETSRGSDPGVTKSRRRLLHA